MRFYGYLGHDALGCEPLGTQGRHLKELKTIRGAIKHFTTWFNDKPFTLYSYGNFYDDETFRLVYKNHHNKEVHYMIN
jgi:hypothetical protein